MREHTSEDARVAAAPMSSVLLRPAGRSLAALGLTAAAARGQFQLQVCDQCKTVQYPPRAACVKCLSDQLEWREQSGLGELIAATAVHHSTDPYFRRHAPWHIGMVRLDAGVTVIAHLHHASVPMRRRVRVRLLLDRSGQGVLFASAIEGSTALADDPKERKMTSSPR